MNSNTYSRYELVFAVVFLLLSGNAFPQQSNFQDYPIQPVNFSDVEIQDEFWSRKIKVNHEVTIPIAISQSHKTGRIDNFKIAGGLKEGSFCSIYPFDDSDVFKIIEAASYSIQTYPDKEMEAVIDSLIFFISEAQEEDGYLYTNRTIGDELHPWAGPERWELVNELSHELYNIGHMYEAAVAHYIATGKKSFLNVAIKSADLVCEVFGPGKTENYPGHQEIEIGLVKLYRVTQNPAYLATAKYFLDVRGTPGIGRPDRYNQSHIKVTEQNEAVGHSVRAAYMWTAMADVAALTGNQEYIDAINALWHDVVDTKYYINGGIGATGSHEGFGKPYELPNMTAYCETCAGVGNAMWNHRMFLMTGESKYIDVLERTMYNNILTGVSHSGDRFFYPNPLASSGQHERSEWFGCACCPPNVARFLPSMPGYIYAQDEHDIYINLFVSSKSEFTVDNQEISIKQESGLPWEGETTITVLAPVATEANLKVRIPGWAKNQPVPGDLYRYQESLNRSISIEVNGTEYSGLVDAKGYININRKWTSGDQLRLVLPLQPRKVIAHPYVEENNRKLAVEYGPLLYCAEWPENGKDNVLNVVIDEKSVLTASYDKELFGGITTIEGEARRVRKTVENELIVSTPAHLKLIPYYLWNNRGPGQMLVWLPTSVFSAKPTPAPTIAFTSSITSSEGSRSLTSIVDQEIPRSSDDHSNSFFHWWPKKDTWEWVQFDFQKYEEVSKVSVYWFDDRPGGGTRIPDEWKISYQKEGKWYPVDIKSVDSISIDAWNSIVFDPVMTDRIKVEVKLSKEYASGIHEIVIE